MAILALTTDLRDMRERLGAMVIGTNQAGEAITAEDLGVAGALTVLMKDAIKPNLMQTLEGTPASSTPGPFANIAHGQSSIIADRIALKLADYVITESGFGADIGMEKFFDIKCRYSGLIPHVVVLVATVRALKMHGGGPKVVAGKPLAPEYIEENLDLLRQACPTWCATFRTRSSLASMWWWRSIPSPTTPPPRWRWCARRRWKRRDGRSRLNPLDGWRRRARLPWPRRSSRPLNSRATSSSCTRSKCPSRKKSKSSARKSTAPMAWITPARSRRENCNLHPPGLRQTAAVHGQRPTCPSAPMPALKGAPSGFRVPVRDIRASVGAGFLYPLLGEMRTMPGLPTRPVFYDVDLDLETGKVVGLF
jgi:methylenetetrahydrofolate dehydrogenase (NADP+) / methenyltetrahydrofolate cyclohydrolase / formyltetrahydrofolate synthetase